MSKKSAPGASTNYQPLKTEHPLPEEIPMITEKAIVVRNAGIVLINQYVKQLFTRTELLSGNRFADTRAQQHAAQLLHFTATGLAGEDALLPLDKLLCGIAADEAVPAVELPDSEKELLTSMLTAMIAHWPGIGATSIAGFRGNWLVRDGFLLEHDDRWTLIVSRHAYDVLLQQSPFAFSIINFPWMPKPLYVTW